MGHVARHQTLVQASQALEQTASVS